MEAEAVLYMRSTNELGGKISLKQQELILEDFCIKNDYGISKRFKEISHGNNFARSEWKSLLKYVEINKSIDIILVCSFEIYSTNLIEARIMTKQLQRMAVILFAVNGLFDITAKTDIN